MPIVAHNSLPSFERLRKEGINVLPPDRASNQYIRELHIGLLNMMPDQALQATERQFLRLLAASNHIAQFYVHLISVPELPRGKQAQQHIDTYYESFAKIKERGLDALIITGANIVGSDLSKELFWNPLIEIVDWAEDNVTSQLCSCLASHAVLDFRYGLKRQRQQHKIWGVFPHRVVNRNHPLVKDINTNFDVPHSRWNSITRQQFDQANLPVLVESSENEVHLATSPDGIRLVFFQGHPEFDTVSLLKEYKRETNRYYSGESDSYPPTPDNTFGIYAQAILGEYKQKLITARKQGSPAPDFPERHLIPKLDNTWHDTGEAVVSHWLGLVYQLTHKERNKPFMDGVDPNKPLDSLLDT